MKNIAIVIPSFAIEYSYDFLEGVTQFCDGKDVRFIVAQTKLPHSTTCIYDYQYWCSMDFLRSKEIDAVIVVTGVYCATPTLNMENFISALKKFSSKPVISVSIKLDLKNTYSLLIDCNKSFSDVIKHLKDVHNCKKLAFLSAISTKSIEAVERFEAFKNGLAENNLEFYPQFVFDGGFTQENTFITLRNTIKTKEDVKFDAVVASNDNMASACIDYFTELGLNIPSDVRVIGFDDSMLAVLSNPKLSTINQQVSQQGYNAAEMAWNIVTEKKESTIKYTPLFPKYRQSCGCIDVDNPTSIYKDNDGNECKENGRTAASLIKFTDSINLQNNIVTLMDMLKGSNTLRQLYYNLPFIVGQINMHAMSVNLYDEPIYLDSKDEFSTPGKVEMYMCSDRVNEENNLRPNIVFDPREKLFATDIYFKRPGMYIIQPIFSGEMNYGFMLCQIKNNAFSEYNVYLKIVSTSIAQAFEYTRKIDEAEKLEVENSKLQENNSNLNRESKTDELTGILNRRGFFEIGQRTLDIMQEMNSAGIVFFFDMDGLKHINDTWGHEMGDKAIRLQAKAIKSIFRSSDVVGRLSGDEFGAVALGMTKDLIPKIKHKLDSANRRISKSNNLPFELSISFGAADLESSTVLNQLLTVADKELYKEKKIKHGQQ